MVAVQSILLRHAEVRHQGSPSAACTPRNEDMPEKIRLLGQPAAFSSRTPVESTTDISSFQDFTNDCAPSS